VRGVTVRLQVLGGGKMGEALVEGLHGYAPGEICIVEKLPNRAEELRRRFDGIDVSATPVAADGTIVAVKPGDVPGLAGGPPPGRVLSIAAGVTIATLEDVFPGAPVIRAMPNTPALVREGAAAIAAGTAASEDDLAWAEEILGKVGIVVRVPEHQLDAVTGLSGSGPAYVDLFVEALIDGGVLAGLPRDVATALATQTVLGAAQLLAQTGMTAADARAAVTSPGGTTAAGLQVLEQRAVRAAVIDAVVAATSRSRELGRG
jgi:pyrroline-5-carboxylate reductase